MRHSSYSDPENHEIEIRPHLQHASVAVRRLEELLEIPTLLLELLRMLKLAPQRLAGPARKSTHIDERPVRSTGRRACLHVELECFDVAIFAPVDRDIFEPMEKLEPNTPAMQHFVQRGEHDVPHAGLHLPEERASIREERPQHRPQRLS